jgi:hypothetical protein
MKLVSQMETRHRDLCRLNSRRCDALAEEYAVCERLWNDFASKANAIQVHEEDVQDDAAEKRPY